MIDIYKDDFEYFLTHTDEKNVLLKEIGNDIERFGVHSVLDIGAGNGDLSIPLSGKVGRYTALERNPDFARTLRQSGIAVIEGTFPVSVTDKYDLVLSSHSLSYKPEYREPFVRGAWDCVDNKGRLLIITYRGHEDDWTNLMKNIGQPILDNNRVGYDLLLGMLRSLGGVEVRAVTTTVQTDTADEMIESLTFVASNGQPDRKKQFLNERHRLTEILNSQYAGDGIYQFPFHHFFLNTHKI